MSPERAQPQGEQSGPTAAGTAQGERVDLEPYRDAHRCEPYVAFCEQDGEPWPCSVLALVAEVEALRGQVDHWRGEYESAEQEINAIATVCAESGVSMDDTHQVVEKVARVTTALAEAQNEIMGYQVSGPYEVGHDHGENAAVQHFEKQVAEARSILRDLELHGSVWISLRAVRVLAALDPSGQVIQRNPNASASPARMPTGNNPSGQRGGAAGCPAVCACGGACRRAPGHKGVGLGHACDSQHSWNQPEAPDARD